MISRRSFLRYLGYTTLAAGASGLGGLYYANEWEPFRPSIERITLALPYLPPTLDGLRLAQLSDLHVGKSFTQENVVAGVTVVNALQPDIIVVTGDYVTHSAADAKACAWALSQLKAPLGVWAILGNHDLWTNAQQVATALRAAGLRVLINEAVQPVAGEALWLLGLDDIWSGKPDLRGVVRGLPTQGCRILLAHEPDYADTAARAEYGIQLQLSGHSHGGQVRLPVLGALKLPNLGRKYDMGLRRLGEMWLYTNRGLGVVEPAVRFNCPPEVTLFTLRPA